MSFQPGQPFRPFRPTNPQPQQSGGAAGNVFYPRPPTNVNRSSGGMTSSTSLPSQQTSSQYGYDGTNTPSYSQDFNQSMASNLSYGGSPAASFRPQMPSAMSFNTSGISQISQMPQPTQQIPQQPQPFGTQPAPTAPDGTPNFVSGIMADPRAAIGMQLGTSAVAAGTTYVKQNFGQFVTFSNFRSYWHVTNRYVLQKVQLLLWPFRHKVWSRALRISQTTQQAEGWKSPREDVNAPDLYIPVMSLVTYVLLSGIASGTADQFHPELLGRTSSTAIGLLAFEVAIMQFGCYLLGVTTEVGMIDFLAYTGYKFVGIMICLIVKMIVTRTSAVFMGVLAYICLSIGFFMLRSIRYVVLPENMISAGHIPQRALRVYFLFGIAALDALMIVYFAWS